jgi:signal transduction histidine kinase
MTRPHRSADRALPLRLVLVALGLVGTWALLLPALLALDAFAFAAARQLGATAAGAATCLALVVARSRLRRGVTAAFSHRAAIDLTLLTSVAALGTWTLGAWDVRLSEPEKLSLLWLQLATGQAAALVQFAATRPLIRALAPTSSPASSPRQGGLPGVRSLFAVSASALALFAAGMLGAGSSGRALGVRTQVELTRVAALADLLAAALPLTTHGSRSRLVELLNSDAHLRAELRPADDLPPAVAEGEVVRVREGHLLVLAHDGRHHFLHRTVGKNVLWVHMPVGVRPPVQAPDEITALVLLALLLLGVPLAALGVGHGLRTTLTDITGGLLAMGPGQRAGAPTGVPVRAEDELGDLAIALNRLCLRAEATGQHLADELAAAEQAEQARNRFLAVASQALRVPLLLISDHFRALERAGELTPAQREDVDAIAGATVQLQSHIDEILALSRLQAGHETPLQKGQVHVGELARTVVNATRMNAAPGVTLAISVDPTTPEVEADGARIRQVLENLVGNALKFTQEGFVQVAVGPSWGGGVHVQVADSGPGIPAEDLTRIFTEFNRVEALRQVPGTGLGLAISQRLVQRHGGSLWAESVLGQGSVFHLRLPEKVPSERSLRKGGEGDARRPTGEPRPADPPPRSGP